MKSTIAQIALLYHMIGWILIRLNGKVPIRGCRLKDYFAKQAQFRREVEMLFPPSYTGNIGIVTGKGSGILVVDLDSPFDVSWAVQRFGNTPFVVQTGKQGFHYYYRYPDGDASIGNRVRLWGRRIDLRIDSGYVVAPPSIHPETKQAYKWVTPLEQLTLDDMPVFNPALLPEKKTLPVSTPPLKSRLLDNKNFRIRQARRYLDKVTCISGHAAHNSLFRACCVLANHFGLNETEMLYLLAEWNSKNCFNRNGQPFPWSRKDLEHKVSDALKTVNFSKMKGKTQC